MPKSTVIYTLTSEGPSIVNLKRGQIPLTASFAGKSWNRNTTTIPNLVVILPSREPPRRHRLPLALFFTTQDISPMSIIGRLGNILHSYRY